MERQRLGQLADGHVAFEQHVDVSRDAIGAQAVLGQGKSLDDHGLESGRRRYPGRQRVRQVVSLG